MTAGAPGWDQQTGGCTVQTRQNKTNTGPGGASQAPLMHAVDGPEDGPQSVNRRDRQLPDGLETGPLTAGHRLQRNRTIGSPGL